jgi:hypothetical protein
MSDTAKQDWVTRVLGIRFGGAGPDPEAVKAASMAWREASEAVDAQISKLQAMLKADDDEEMQEIAEFGLNGLTSGHEVAVTAALIGAQRGNAADVPKLAAAAREFQRFLETDERIEACDENPFGVPIDIRGQLLPALGQLAALAR